MSDQTQEQKTPRVEAFTFGDPEPVLDAREILDMSEAWWNGQWYEPPVSLAGLAKSFRANPHHSSAIYVKRNILVSTFIPSPMLTRQDFSRWALDFIMFGNGYLQRIDNMLGNALRLAPLPTKYTRRGKNSTYWWVPNMWEKQQLPDGKVFHLIEPDPNQELYGVPEYLAALQSVWLNESATLFRRKYYINGSHAGFVMYLTDPVHDEKDIENLRTALKQAKGPGNFRNLFMYAPNGKKDGIQIIPIAEVQAKDEFLNIKNVSRDDILAGHRIPPQLMGIVPSNAGGFGDVEKAAKIFVRNELEPLQERMSELNDWLGVPVISFKPYDVGTTASQP